MMDETRRHALLALARDTILAHLSGAALPPLPDLGPEPQEYGGVFVTLRNAHRLRGCIGEFRSGHQLADAVQRMAVAALSDPRFTRDPVTLREVPSLSIEISVLSPMQRTHTPELLQPGVHGVYLRHHGRGGCFLPQVATEQGWGALEMLSYCCTHKAGLAPDAWKDPETEVYLFTAEVLQEDESSGPGGKS
ncbi:MAG TPA: AmmeMemoRadiSam system protein A [Phycisphaerae bacterium]|jgi:AmmeMemoRadiSam system protein A|nr:AmmeMemoRadiSam system protein A [Phycisphaerae bacterium]HOJ53684.1 AmmeMemoRadiSam system protein A [Phycisphaerae bacterium]HOL27997.1 AmmeMemoRadiSam system protein A [Phycisphaerae bacterium]HPP22355.1 AmmeMemoRadiSam system protein A [Phycisphaerae bacterium]HPU34517.1 AmmeMemoRadiSam system protein A [Phycisphaerae bacterium]